MESKTKKPLLVFTVTVGASLILYCSSVLRGYLHFQHMATLNYWILASQTLVYLLIDIPVVLALFYFLGKRDKINVSKTIVLALLAGALIGNILFLRSVNFPRNLTYLPADIYTYVEYLASNLFHLFFPALTAFLLVEIREKKTNNSLITQQS